jgi:hypothetical protein
VPQTGETIEHPRGLIIEILESDPRRVVRAKLRGPRPPPSALAEDKPAEKGPLFVGGFGAYHPGVAVAGMGDGSTRGLSFTIDREVLHALGSRAGGELPGAEW